MFYAGLGALTGFVEQIYDIRGQYEMLRTFYGLSLHLTMYAGCTNLRGDDVDFFPLLLSYAVITMDEMKLYIDERKLNDDMKADLAKNNITIHPYNAIYEDIKNLDTASTVLVDPNRLNYALFNNIPGGTKVVQQVNPTIAMKARKMMSRSTSSTLIKKMP